MFALGGDNRLESRKSGSFFWSWQAKIIRMCYRHLAVPVRACVVSFVDSRGIRHSAEVEAESLYEATVLGVTRLNHDAWIEKIGPATVLDIEIREPATAHSISLQQVERWLAGATTNPIEAMKKAKLKMMLVQR
jgi:hypothetical protein